MLTHTINIPVSIPRGAAVVPGRPAYDNFCLDQFRSGLITTKSYFKKDEELYGEDEPADYVYQVKCGAVRTYKLLSDGRRQIGTFHLPCDVFGIEFGPAYRLTAEAIIDTTVHLVKRRSLEVKAAKSIQTAHDLLTMTACSLRHAEDHMLLLGRKTAMERVATFLLEMDRRLTVAGMLALPMCRRDIADYLGLTLETVSRTLSQLHNRGVLEFSGARQIVLRNRQRLLTLEARGKRRD